MKIIDKSRQRIKQFDDIPIGEGFHYNNHFYIKTGLLNGFNLTDRLNMEFRDNPYVESVKMEIIIK